MQVSLEFNIAARGSIDTRTFALTTAVIAGWTGRDRAAMEKHIAELEALGVARPPRTPVFYRSSVSRLTTADVIEVVGDRSSGEVEFVLVQQDGALWVGVGSDHTDRQVETYNVTVSKQMCDKPMATALWAYDELAGHWDQLILRSFAISDGHREVYQEGTASAMLPPHDLIAKFTNGASRLPEGTVMFCGTIAARGGVRPAERFEFEIEDPTLNRRISHRYDVIVLPVEG